MSTNSRLPLDAKPIAGSVGAAVSAIDLREDLSVDVIADLHSLLAERGVVVFTDQHLDVAGHLAFASLLGEVRRPPDYLETLRDEGYPDVGVLRSNPGGNGADTWHADVTWAVCPPRYSVAHMQVLPDAGGDTMWASQILAYERLSPAMRHFLGSLTAEHAGRPGRHAETVGGRSAVHPVVHRHPVTGRAGLSVNPLWTRRILELSPDESEGVLRILFNEILQPASIARWRWSAGEVCIWDNQFVLHYAIYDYGDAPRLLHRIEIEGQPLIPMEGDDQPARPEGSRPRPESSVTRSKICG